MIDPVKEDRKVKTEKYRVINDQKLVQSEQINPKQLPRIEKIRALNECQVKSSKS